MAASASTTHQRRLTPVFLGKASFSTRSFILRALVIIVFSSSTVTLGQQLASCGGQCNSNGDCEGMLACINGQCNDDPEVGSHICTTPAPGPSASPVSAPTPTNSSPSPSPSSSTCSVTGFLHGTGHACNTADDSSCCTQGTEYPQYECSPRVTAHTPAMLTLNSFQRGGDGGGPSACDGDYHSDSDPVVALSTGWYDGGSRCLQQIRVFGNGGHSVLATVVDECDSVHGCGPDWDYQPPCHNNIVDASNAVWEALGVSEDSSYYGMMHITWTDA